MEKNENIILDISSIVNTINQCIESSLKKEELKLKLLLEKKEEILKVYTLYRENINGYK